jgi:hypothetical protein
MVRGCIPSQALAWLTDAWVLGSGNLLRAAGATSIAGCLPALTNLADLNIA